jgi:tyrosyl-tRNA synthetase
MDIEEKIRLVKEVGVEIINEEELRKLFEEKENPVAYDGFEPSGRIHIAQGLLRAININKLTSTGIRFKMYVADWFGLLNNKMGGDLDKIRTVGEYFVEVWKACGMDLDKVEFVWASDFIKNHPEYWETVLKLSMNATVTRVLRCGQIMGREESAQNPSAQILYPLMQAADIHHLGADIAQLGLDQRKVNMLARDIFPKIGLTPPVIVSHHMLLGLQKIETDVENAIDKKIAMKMSKSKPDTAIFMTDTEEKIKRKFNKAYCPEGEVEDNPVLEYCRYIVFEKLKESGEDFVIERPEKWGGNMTFANYVSLQEAFVKKELHPMDLKQATAKYINTFVEPVRKHFEEDENAKKLLETVNGYYSES